MDVQNGREAARAVPDRFNDFSHEIDDFDAEDAAVRQKARNDHIKTYKSKARNNTYPPDFRFADADQDGAAYDRSHMYYDTQMTDELQKSDRNLFKYKKFNDPDGAAWTGDPGEGCDTASKDDKLREILMMQLYDMASSTTNVRGADVDDDTGCAFACGEDAELERMQDMYKKFNQTMSGPDSSKPQTGLCGIGDFSNNPRIQVLESQRRFLEFISFSFLHQTCEGTSNCNPYKHIMPRALLKCCGLYEGAPLFYDGDLQAVGSYLAGPQGSPKGLTPAANGHCANFYMSGTIAPGRDKQLYVNVCYFATAGERGAIAMDDAAAAQPPREGGEAGPAAKQKVIGMKWVKANRLERAKFEAMREIDAKIIAAKRMVLQMNHKMLQLQQSLVGLNPNVMGYGYGGAGQEHLLTNRLREVVRASTRRVRNEMGRRNGAIEDRQMSMLPQLGLSPRDRAGSGLRAIDNFRRTASKASKASRRAGSRRARSRASRAGSRSRSGSRSP
jgi:hypothetical protein